MNRPAPSTVLLLDSNAPWVCSLAEALPGLRERTIHLHAWRVYGLRYWLRHHQGPAAPTSHPGITRSVCVVPGWKRFHTLSTALLTRRIKGCQSGRPQVIIYTLPHYADVARQFRGCRQAYYAYDSYRHYTGWSPTKIDALEKRLLDACDLAFAVSRALASDLQRLTRTPVLYSPNAVAAGFLRQMTRPQPVPDSLKSVRGKIVGCVGQISRAAYDWPLLEGLLAALPEFTFVFLGPIIDDPPGSRSEVQRILNYANVRWLGPVPHDELAPYLARFDVCLGPYADNPLNQRRSPLRLYDYLCTSKPVLFTNIEAARACRDHLEIAATVDHCVALLKKMTSPEYRADVPARLQFLENNTWEKRAETFWQALTTH